jgi:dCTP deaminase
MGLPGFWSGETLALRLPSLIKPFDPARLDCSAYTLAMGREVYVSPSDEVEEPQSVTIRQLGDGEGFTIPPGQFGFLLTDEIVKIPDDALGFISIKAKIKWRGLINVSGFHVDPCFNGRLIFSVYNAGPVPVHLRQGQPMFLLWLASLDSPTKRGRHQPVQLSFPPDLIPGISGELQSIAGVNKKIKDVDKDLTKRIHDIEREQTYYRIVAIVALAIFAAMVTNWVREGGPRRLFAPSTAVQDSATPLKEANMVTATDAGSAANTAASGNTLANSSGR